MKNLSSLIVFALTFLIVGKAFPGEPSLEVLSVLNRSSDPSLLGSIVVFDGKSLSKIVDVLGDGPLNVPTGWISSDRTKGMFAHLRPRVAKCINGSWYFDDEVWLWTGEISKNELSRPHQTLEVFNRRLTGLTNNEEAELRLMQWRSTVTKSLARKEHVYLVTGLDVSLHPVLVSLGKRDSFQIVDGLEKFASKYDWLPLAEKPTISCDSQRCRVELSVQAPLVLGLRMRRIEIEEMPHGDMFVFGEKKEIESPLQLPGK